jgi:hypothetical protein
VYDGDRQAPQDLLNLLSKRTDMDPGRWQMHHVLILEFLCRKASASASKIFWIQKILLEEFVRMYEIIRVLDMAGSYPNALLICRLWYKGEDLPNVEKQSTSERYGCT